MTIGGTTRNYIARINAGGSLDTAFDPNANERVWALALQPDGKIVLGGVFTAIGGTTRNYVARLNADGSVDSTFDPDANNEVRALALQGDGKIALGGHFTTIGGTTRNYIARLNPDGSLDTTFDPNASYAVLALALQADGKLVLGGFFSAIGGRTRNHIARLNADGTLDAAFDPNASSRVGTLVLQPDGKVVLGGRFDTLSGTARGGIARLNSDGSLDTIFDPNKSSSAHNFEQRMVLLALQTDGKLVVRVFFTLINGPEHDYLARLNADGSFDTEFDPSKDYAVRTQELPADGNLILVLGGAFDTHGWTSHDYIARLNPDGSLDGTFKLTANNTVAKLAIQADGKLVMGGMFTEIEGTR